MRIAIYSLRRTLITIAIALVTAGAVWLGLWGLAASQLRSSLDGWIASGRASGYAISYDRQDLFGFPHHVVLRFVNLNWKNPDGITFHTDQIDLSSLPWDHETFNARFHGHAEILAPLEGAGGLALALGGDSGTAHVVLNPDGTWKSSRVSLTQAKFGRVPDFAALADKLEATAERPNPPPQDHTRPSLILAGSAENVTLPGDTPAPFGPKMEALEASLRVMGNMPDFRRKDSVAAWNNDSGVVEFDKLHMEWGPLRLTAKGTIGFDDDLQPEGAFSSTLGNHDQVLKMLMEHGFIAQRQEGMLTSALNLFAKKSDGKGDIDLPITIQLGGLFFGPVRLFVFPPIQWPKAPAGAP